MLSGKCFISDLKQLWCLHLHHFVCLIPLALLLELAEPALWYFICDCVDHPLGEFAHDVKTVDEEDICDVLLKRFIKSPLKHEADND